MTQRDELEILLSVVDQGSFSAAARTLGYTPSAVGKRVYQLEQKLRVPLLVRSTRRMALTAAGQRYVEEARELLDRLKALEENLADDANTLRGTIRLTCPAALGRTHITPLSIEFMAHHPDVEIDLLLTDAKIDLVAEGFDLAIRSGVMVDSSLLSRKLSPHRRLLCATPSYLRIHGAPHEPEELSNHRCLRLRTEKELPDWGFASQSNMPVRLGGGMASNSLDALHTACRAGRGIAWLPEFLVREDLENGSLVTVLSEFAENDAGGGVYLLRPDTAYLPQRTRTLIDFIATYFADLNKRHCTNRTI